MSRVYHDEKVAEIKRIMKRRQMRAMYDCTSPLERRRMEVLEAIFVDYNGEARNNPVRQKDQSDD